MIIRMIFQKRNKNKHKMKTNKNKIKEIFSNLLTLFLTNEWTKYKN